MYFILSRATAKIIYVNCKNVADLAQIPGEPYNLLFFVEKNYY